MERKISPYQLFATMFILPYGSAVLFFLAPDAKQDAWLVILIYILPGLLLQQVHIRIFKYYPKDTLVSYMPKIWGKYLGIFFSVLYILYFEYLSARVLRDFTGLITISAMPHTSRIFIGVLLILTVTYGISTGFETICRAAEILFPLMILGLITAYILLFSSKNMLVFNRLLPILEDGLIAESLKSWKLIAFPFGEFIAFSMLYRTLNEPQKIKKIVPWVVVAEGIALSSISVLFIAGLGVNYSTTTNFPLLETLRLIHVGGFLDRLDILIVVTLVTGGFMKISIFMYVSILGTAQLFKVRNQRYLAFPFGIMILIYSELIARSYPQHIKIGLDFTVKYIHVPLQIIVPIITLVIAYFKNKPKRLPNS
ncbi:GerAB/ArcD/ProY family transporter [Clostridium sp. YIM B02515]|uniref:GerAB/ArcD/ProY family transporter n=1 Tax=Clostridium rhizosphaerae TaxID=2803861 RepID=A0ABS1TDN6_9CLOT|nr:GerAB/ArcD/ProY family transporter [Clostridium rhizosphaerae]MBL4936454.1 GerAB/ArcD/ProY family transporter [Clostridium rhizosphaerae]